MVLTCSRRASGSPPPAHATIMNDGLAELKGEKRDKVGRMIQIGGIACKQATPRAGSRGCGKVGVDPLSTNQNVPARDLPNGHQNPEPEEISQSKRLLAPLRRRRLR